MLIWAVVSLDAVAPVPWKNGGGSTRTLAVHPEGASLDDFIWRVSLAEVASSGPFSAFPGIDRTIALWSGKGMLLESPGRAAHRLVAELEPYEFPGEISVEATLLDGTTVDFNLMVRRGAVAGSLQRVDSEMLLPQADDVFLVCRRGSFRVGVVTLGAGQMLHVSEAEEGVVVAPVQSGSILLCVVIG